MFTMFSMILEQSVDILITELSIHSLLAPEVLLDA